MRDSVRRAIGRAAFTDRRRLGVSGYFICSSTTSLTAGLPDTIFARA